MSVETDKINENIIVKYYSIDSDTQLASGFYSNSGWSAEPVCKALEIPDDICSEVFEGNCKPDPDLSITLQFGDKYIGMCNVDKYVDYWKYFPHQVRTVLEKNINDNINNFCKINLESFITQMCDIIPVLENLDINIKYIAHRCGLMVISEFNGKGYGTFLINKSDEYLKKQGYKAVIVTASHLGSQRVFEKNNYIMVRQIDHIDFGIVVEPGKKNSVGVMYKIL